jgi:hypothetical protein
MPHIEDKKNRRAYLVNNPATVLRDQNLSIADIEYIISQYVTWYVKQNGLSFKTLNEIHGMFNTATQEFYRCVTGPYEKFKANLNGNAYDELVEIIKDLSGE